MVDQNGAYTFQKRGTFYFSKRVPSDLRKFYKSMTGLIKTPLSHKRVLTTYLFVKEVGAYNGIGFVYYYSHTIFKC